MADINISEKLLENINDLVSLYNELPNVEKIAVILEKYTKSMNIPFPPKEEKIDVKNMYIGLFDKDKVAAFEKKHIVDNPNCSFSWQSIYDVFKQYKGDLVGAYIIKEVATDKLINDFASCGIYKTTNINCKLDAVESYDILRQLMLEEGIITTYKPGESTESEMLKVISFARKYYEEKDKSEPSLPKIKTRKTN